jgi:hypothetical protein
VHKQELMATAYDRLPRDLTELEKRQFHLFKGCMPHF